MLGPAGRSGCGWTYVRPGMSSTEARATVRNLSFWGAHPPDVVRLAKVIEASYTARRSTIRGVDLATKRGRALRAYVITRDGTANSVTVLSVRFLRVLDTGADRSERPLPAHICR